MIDVDSIISEEEKILVEDSFRHEEKGKLISLSYFKNEQGL